MGEAEELAAAADSKGGARGSSRAMGASSSSVGPAARKLLQFARWDIELPLMPESSERSSQNVAIAITPHQVIYLRSNGISLEYWLLPTIQHVDLITFSTLHFDISSSHSDSHLLLKACGLLHMLSCNYFFIIPG